VKHLLITFFTVLISFGSVLFGAEGEVDLVMKRERVKRQLEKVGYVKWQQIQLVYVEQSLGLKKLELKMTAHDIELRRVVAQYQRAKFRQKLELEKMALKDPEAATAYMKTQGQENGEVETGIAKARQESEVMKELFKRHRALVEKLENEEVALREMWTREEVQVREWVQQWKKLSEQIAAIDAKRQKK